MLPLLAPRYWAIHLLALVLAGTAGALGLWQYDAWQTRRANEAVDLTQLEPMALASVIGADDPFPGNRIGQPVVLSGTWVPDSTLYISGRVQDGVEGYWVVTPLAISRDGDPAIPVVRGWVSSPDEAPSPPRGQAEFVGWLQAPQGTGQVDADRTDDVLPQLRIADLIQYVDQDLYGAYVVVADQGAPGDWPIGDRATNDGTDGLVAATLEQLPDAGRFTAVRNLLYAVEWWVFGAFALFIWSKYLQDELLLRRTEAAAEAADAAGEGESEELPDEQVPSTP